MCRVCLPAYGEKCCHTFAFRFSKRRKHSLFRSGLIFSRFHNGQNYVPGVSERGCHSALCVLCLALEGEITTGDNKSPVGRPRNKYSRRAYVLRATVLLTLRAHQHIQMLHAAGDSTQTRPAQQPRVAFGHTTHVCTASERAHARVQRRPSTTSQRLLQPGAAAVVRQSSCGSGA